MDTTLFQYYLGACLVTFVVLLISYLLSGHSSFHLRWTRLFFASAFWPLAILIGVILFFFEKD